MADLSPQRYIANNANHIRTATLVPSSVLPVSDQVLSLPVARVGTAEARITGGYTGDEEALIDVEIVDTAATNPLISAPIFSGEGSSKLVDLSAAGVSAQQMLVELVDAGAPATYASVAFEGVSLRARSSGAIGNSIRIEIDQSGITLSNTDFALLVDLKAGQGGPNSGLEGSGFDWQTAVLGADNAIPATAKRVAFGDDRSTIYLAYKRYVDNKWLYHFVPELKRDVSRGTPVKFVTGGRTVTVGDGGSPDETYTGIVTVYDLLNALRTSSALLVVDGVVAKDRAPTGQAALELLARTDAYVEPSYGSGGAATTMTDTFANPNARTELVVAKCYAVKGDDHPLARLGYERWRVTTSLAGDLGDAVTGAPFVEAADRFGFVIPRRLPTGYETQRGQFEHVETNYVSRPNDAEPPPICPVSLRLGPEAVDQTITLRWTKRPSGDCDCKKLPKPFIGGRCLGTIEEGGAGDMSYSEANRQRLIALYQWFADVVRLNSRLEPITLEGGAVTAALVGTQEPGLTEPVAFDFPDASPESIVYPSQPQGFDPIPLRDVVGLFEAALAQINALADNLSPDLRAEGETAWDAAVVEFQADVDEPNDTGATGGPLVLSYLTERYRARVNQVLITAGISPLGKSDASALESGDGCWRDIGDAYYWTVEGSAKGGYAHAFVNQPYYSSRRADQDGAHFATFEFGFQINVKPSCVGKLLVGDEIVFRIGGAGLSATYQVGDELILPVVAAQPLYLAGGRDDNALQTWSVTGSVDGPFAAWQFVPGGSGSSYSDGGLSWDIEQGGVPNAKGDHWTFAIEGGHYRYRVDGGVWSAPVSIPDATDALVDGLSIQFVPGATPSFAVGDIFSFRALQPWAVSNLRTPTAARWRWADGDSPGPTLDADLGSAQSMDAVAIALHTIPQGATITLLGGVAAAGEWSETITWRAGTMVQMLSQTRTAQYLQLALVNAAGGGIGWWWVGQALRTSLSAVVRRRSTFRLSRGDSTLNARARTLGSAQGCDVDWSDGALSLADMTAVVGLFDWAKTNDDEPIIVVPHYSRPEDAVLGTIEVDQLDFDEVSGENRDAGAERRYSLSLPVQGYLR